MIILDEKYESAMLWENHRGQDAFYTHATLWNALPQMYYSTYACACNVYTGKLGSFKYNTKVLHGGCSPTA